MKVKVLPILLASTAFCIFLYILRAIESHTDTYWYMMWNLFLAWIPLLFSSYLPILYDHKKKITPLVIVCFGLWLLFFPNAPYLVTDIIHLKLMDTTPLWFDLVLLESFAMVGFFITFISLLQVQGVIKKHYGHDNARYSSIAILYLTSVGVAVGRFFRWNSWDIFAPTRMVAQILSSVMAPTQTLQAFAFSTFFFFFLSGIYLVIVGLQRQRE